MNEIEILSKFKSNLINFLEELDEIIPDDPDLITLRIFINDQIPTQDLVKSFIQNLYQHKDKVISRDANFFLNKKDLFTKVKPETLEKFKRIWRSNHLEDADRKAIWAWADLFYKLGDEYVKIGVLR